MKTGFTNLKLKAQDVIEFHQTQSKGGVLTIEALMAKPKKFKSLVKTARWYVAIS